jgi:CheY-like chemotaxis protein
MSEPARVLVVDDSVTILKVVSSILSRHGFEPTTARDGAIAIDLVKASPRFDLVLLDFVMPRMNGYQFCRELRSSPEHRSVPVVLMSAKGDKIRGQFVQQTGAVDAITKPFDARALVAVVQGALSKATSGRARTVPDGLAMPDEATVDAVHSFRPSELASPPTNMRARIAIQVAQQVAAAVVPAISALPLPERGSEAALHAAVARAMTPEVQRTLAQTLGAEPADADASAEAKVVMSGELAAIPLAEILQVLQMQRQTGVLRVTSGRSGVTMWIRQGSVELVQAHNVRGESRIGRYFLESGRATREQIDDALKGLGDGQLLGEALLQRGLVTQADLDEALKRQSSEHVYEMLRWPTGRFTFTIEPFKREAESAHLGLGISALVLEGFRRVDEWRLMEGIIDFDQVVFVDTAALAAVGKDKLTRTERLVLDAVDGQRKVSEVVEGCLASSFDALKVIYQFLQSRLLRTRTG